MPYEIDEGIVRGLDYYTRTVFEFVTEDLGAQGTVCGGGRYDNLVQSIGGKPTGCVGFAMGVERILMLMEKQGITFPDERVGVFVMSQSADQADACMRITAELRRAGVSADTEMTGRSLKAQFKYADKIGARFGIVIGGNEISSGTVKIKNLSDGTEEECALGDIAARMKEKING